MKREQQNIIEIENLSLRFSDGGGGIDNICLNIPKGEFVVIAGPNGSGKTTLLKHINGLLCPDTGVVRVCGERVSENPLRTRQRVGMIFQDADSQIIGETVADDVAFGPENLCIDRTEIQKRVQESLNAVGLADFANRRPHLLSGGEKRRLAIAGVLAMKPEILIFDEPFSNLDYPGMGQVLTQIVNLHRSGKTILVTSHDLEQIIPYADRLILMKDGKIVRNGSPERLLPELEQFGVRRPCHCRLREHRARMLWLN